MFSRKSRFTLFLLTLTVLFAALQYAFFRDGYFGADDMEYCRLAADVLKGKLTMSTNLYAYRWAVFFPLALLYKVFGIGDFANMLLGLTVYLCIVFVLLKMLRDSNHWTKLLGVLFIIWSPIHLLYLGKPMPDVWVELGFLICFYTYFNVRFEAYENVKRAALGFTFGFIMLFLAKESFLVFYPLFVFLFIEDVLKNRRRSFWAWCALGLFSFFVLYFSFFALSGVSPIARVNAIFHERFVSACSYDFQPTEVLLRRIGYTLWRVFFDQGILLPVGFLVFGLGNSLTEAKDRFVFRSLFWLFMLANFMSITYTAYVPLCDDSRHFLYLLPLLAYVFAVGLANLPKSSVAVKGFVLGSMAIQIGFCLYFQNNNQLYLHVPVFFGTLLWALLGDESRKRWNWLALVFIISGLATQYYISVKYYRSLRYYDQCALLDFIKKDTSPKVRIVTDNVNRNICLMHLQYDTTRIKVIEYEAFTPAMQIDTSTKTFLVMNGYTAFYDNLSWEELPTEIQKADKDLPKAFSNKGGTVTVWNKSVLKLEE